jgi:peptidoglycan/xylan/chitin deacetylase (PgdA/CDA1 family)
MRLNYMRLIKGRLGHARVIHATFSRGSSSELTARFLPRAAGLGYVPVRWQVVSALRPPACIPKVPNPFGCQLLYPRHGAVARLHTPRLVGCVPSGPAYVTNGSRNRRVVALTFDDGPWYDTPQFLNVLEHYHVPATFFQIGEQISTYGGPVEHRILRDGDMIGDHTWNHANVSGGGSFAAGEISRTASAIRSATGGFTPCLFRAPGGAVSGGLISEARRMGFTTIEWDVDPRDWSRPGTGAIYSTVVNNARPGSIILQHDGGGDRSETLAALPQEIRTLRSRGYGFVTVTQLLGQRLIYK